MKVLLINGSSNNNGCTYTALSKISEVFNDEGIETEIINIGNKEIRDCIGCKKCRTSDDYKNKCVFDNDIVNEISEKAKYCDGFVFGTPVYYAHPSGRILSVLDRLFYSSTELFKHKPGFAIASARRAGTTASIDVLNKYFTIAQMPIVSSTYWNVIHGNTPQETLQDKEGIETIENCAKNMIWLLKCIEIGKNNDINPPKTAKNEHTNFIR